MRPAVVDRRPAPKPPAAYNMAADILKWADTDPDRGALDLLDIDGVETITFGALATTVRRISGGMAKAGLQPGDRVLLRLGHHPDFPRIYLGAIAGGYLPIPASAALTPAELDVITRDCAPRLIVAHPGATLPTAPPCPVVQPLELARAAEADFLLGRADRPAYIVYTSGTSGRPRGVVHAHRAFFARRMMHQGWYGLMPEDRLCHAGAFNWTFTLGTGLCDPWSVGATALILARGFDRQTAAGLISAAGATILAAAPGIFRQLIENAEPLDFPALRHGLAAGEALSPTIRQRWREETGTEIYTAFGMTECSTFISQAPPLPATAGSTGYAQPGRKVAVLGPDGAPVARGEGGLLAVAADDPGLMLRYWDEDRPDLMNGWFVTGDRARMADDGAITHEGRDDDMLNAGGIRVSPLEIEAVLNTHPDVRDAACAEVEVREGVRVIGAWIVGDAEPGELGAHCAERLARYKCPRRYFRTRDLPRNANGKLMRRKLVPPPE